MMPSPFPGMDPFLENQNIFPDLHDSFIAYVREAIQGRLPEPYFAGLGSRIWLDFARRQIGPDVQVSKTEHTKSAGDNGASEDEASGGVAVATRTRPVVITVPHDEFREPFLEIRRIEGNEQRLVTVVEILSLTNKSPGEKGRELYLQKQQEILDSEIHLVEIDLLRGGTHSTAVPLDALQAAAPSFEYHVCVRRFDRWEDYFVYPVALDEMLPEIAVPLLPGDGAVAVDLQEIFQRTYEAGAYQRRIRYQENEIVPPLPEKWRGWAAEVVARAGSS